MDIRFNTPHQYLFYHQNVKHLFLLWKKEKKRELYIVEDDQGHILLRYPGETYVDTVLHEIEPIFFQHLVNEEGPLAVILGATFSYKQIVIGMYYTPPHPNEDLYFFQIEEERIREIEDSEYENVVHEFMTKFKDYI